MDEKLILDASADELRAVGLSYYGERGGEDD